MSCPLFRQVSIVGLGLIGGSLGMALRQKKIARRVVGFSRHPETIRRAKARGAIRDGDTKLCTDWLGASDLVILAVPPERVLPIAQKIVRLTHHRFILTDVASTKAWIVQSLDRMLPKRIAFIGSHPMAGSQRSGIEAADPHLFHQAVCILTPTARTDPKALWQVARMWECLGSRVERISPQNHDRLVAQISHLPHLVASALTLTPSPKALQLVGSGFLDTTRIAASDPDLWIQILATNRAMVLKALMRHMTQLALLTRLIRLGQMSKMRRWLRAAQRRRMRLDR